MINGNESERLTLDFIHQQATNTNNSEAIAELSKIKIPFSSWEQLYYQRKWSAYFSGSKSSKKTYPKRLFEDWSLKWMPFFLEASSINYAESVTQLNYPIYFFLAKKDLVANYAISQKYFDSLITD